MFRYLLITLAAVFLASCGEQTTHILIETDMGNMKLRLYNSTPKHRNNMVKLANEGFYDGLLFHRVIPNFMIQGGDPNSRDAAPEARLGAGGPGYLIDAEIGAPHLRGALAAARTGGPSNPEKKSSGSQFYIVYGGPVSRGMLQNLENRKGIQYSEEQVALYEENGGYPSLDNDYTVFGELVEGLDVVEKIQKSQTDNASRPLKDVVMNKVSVVK
jgi:peptidyl-prolyl cis-trans isomerase B (cyclophilin B)